MIKGLLSHSLFLTLSWSREARRERREERLKKKEGREAVGDSETAEKGREKRERETERERERAKAGGE